ncbi:type I-F CRISPR-associated endoribonuclease Cas6/Csy4 [Photobacterium leiognathi]|uniref:type I-F CRISPR-associated endoribonuclease Cas6/Csy4 n=1 Tax=Photobacterium leiognathi TaxID=553611 RepID=UPI002736EA63|nr:type I-F CRISPR-associated endoribonuclease Cas6/Csy4 [Photobacterium leiognathi]
MNWYYISIHFISTHCNNEVLAAKCIKILHGFSYRNNIRSIGISFPNWSEETVGNKISFVSTDKIILESLIKQKYFMEMHNLGFFTISETLVAPTDCDFVSFKRCQKIDKSSAAGFNRKIQRLAKRAKARGEEFDFTKYNIHKQYDLKTITHWKKRAKVKKDISD